VRRRTRRWILGLAAAAVVYLAVSTVVLLTARSRLVDGVDDLRALRDTTTVEEIAAGVPLPGLRRAADTLAAGHSRLRSPLLWPLRQLPFIGTQLRSANALARSAVTATRVGTVAAADARRALAMSTGGAPGRVAMVERLAETAATARAGIDAVDLGPRRALVAPLADAREELAGELSALRRDLRRAESVGRMLTALLRGPRRFLLVAGNNAEMRAGAGMFLQAGELTTVDGRLALADMRSTATSPLRELMATPRFDVNGPEAARMWEALGYAPVDGVIAIDPLTLQAVLRATGPVEVDGRMVSGDAVVDELLFHQYQRFRDRDRSERREELGLIARAAFDALDAGKWRAATLARELTRAADGRHLLAWSRDATEQRAWRTLGVDGALTPDSLLVASSNVGGNKLDRWLSVRASLDLRPAGRRTDAVLRIDVENRAPTGAAPYVVGPSPGLGVGEGVYRGLLAVTVPGRASGVVMEGVGPPQDARRDGPTQVVGAVVDLARGERRTVVVRFTLPRRGAVRVESSARFPHVQWSAGAATWRDDRARRVAY
jgi:hypothetical protein